MAAPSKSWVTIADSQVDADSPGDTVLITGIRDDLVHLREWLGMSYTAAQNHDHDGVNSAFVTSVADGAITNLKFTEQVAGDYLVDTNATERSMLGAAYTKLKETTWLLGSSTIRIKFSLKSDGTNLVYGKIYRNGAAVGTERTTTSATYVTYSEDIAGWVVGDLIQVYVHSGGAGLTAYVQDLLLYTDFFNFGTPTSGY